VITYDAGAIQQIIAILLRGDDRDRRLACDLARERPGSHSFENLLTTLEGGDATDRTVARQIIDSQRVVRWP
jgi:hypothetical protein